MTDESAQVRCLHTCRLCEYETRCQPHIDRIRAEHAQHLLDTRRAGGDVRFVPRVELRCAVEQFTPKKRARLVIRREKP